MLYGERHYSGFIDGQESSFALFEMSKRTNLDIQDAAYLRIAHDL